MTAEAGDNQEGQKKKKKSWELEPCSYVFYNFQKRNHKLVLRRGHTSFHKTQPSLITDLNGNWVFGTVHREHISKQHKHTENARWC